MNIIYSVPVCEMIVIQLGYTLCCGYRRFNWFAFADSLRVTRNVYLCVVQLNRPVRILELREISVTDMSVTVMDDNLRTVRFADNNLGFHSCFPFGFHKMFHFHTVHAHFSTLVT